MLGGEFNGVRTAAGGDVDLKTTGNTDGVGTITAIDVNGGKAITTTAEVVFSSVVSGDRDFVVAGPAVGSDINPSVVAIAIKLLSLRAFTGTLEDLLRETCTLLTRSHLSLRGGRLADL